MTMMKKPDEVQERIKELRAELTELRHRIRKEERYYNAKEMRRRDVIAGEIHQLQGGKE